MVLGWMGISGAASGSGDKGDRLTQAMLGNVDFFISCIFTICNHVSFHIHSFREEEACLRPFLLFLGTGVGTAIVHEFHISFNYSVSEKGADVLIFRFNFVFCYLISVYFFLTLKYYNIMFIVIVF